jgi:hypothetical protein
MFAKPYLLLAGIFDFDSDPDFDFDEILPVVFCEHEDIGIES